jgi:ABC-type lipoprotein export system ATPase subunit
MINSQSIRFGISSLSVVAEMLSMTRVSERAEDRPRDAHPRTITSEIRVEVHKLVSPSGTILMENEEFRLARGEVVVVVGPSGIGKSTLVRALIDGAPGLDIFAGGERVRSGLADLKALRIGMAGQRALVLPETLAFNVMERVPPEDKQKRIPETEYERMVLQTLGDLHEGSLIGSAAIEQNLSCPISASALSGGQGQRIGLMRALLLGTDLLILDEPTSALDSRSRDRFIALLRELMPSRMILIVSHDPAFESLATQVFKIGVSRDDTK